MQTDSFEPITYDSSMQTNENGFQTIEIQTDCQINAFETRTKGRINKPKGSLKREILKGSPGEGFWRSQIDFISL